MAEKVIKEKFTAVVVASVQTAEKDKRTDGNASTYSFDWHEESPPQCGETKWKTKVSYLMGR